MAISSDVRFLRRIMSAELMVMRVSQVPKLDLPSKSPRWHTFRHTYSTLLWAVGADLKVMQELLRHSTIRVTLDTYTQAVTAAKRTAHTAVVSLIVGNVEWKRLRQEGERSAA
jgi:site-specific recombinase XerD